MESNNNNGKGIFYGVIGVATLVVAIIGATFAYFSATVTPGEGSEDIQGATNGDFASSLSLMVNKVDLGGEAPNDDLVPADFGVAPSSMTTTEINRALTAKCVNEGYTGCHVWKIEAEADQTIQTASILLDLSVDSAVVDKTDWSYALYQGTDSSATSLVTLGSGSPVGGFGTTALSQLDIHNAAGLTEDVPVTYYLMVYLNNEDLSQNTADDEKNATGSYSGSVTMQAAGGQVVATFAA